ncbi:MAG: phosphoribosylformylglycinamidine cyclo-ligase [Halobacteriovoraceae bacterium]|nr:phosphoribosylformylglycinamidine cyclo-ligase [Halobacteriovoraceae bacterium]MBT5094276.1 phosphoribosylformylglycinamidine cyclo-ligase [Halobacteriovoraceae bacterium]
MTYKDAGVDIEKGDALVEKIKSKVSGTYGNRVLSGVGGFACLYKITEERILAAGTDGVGTKLMLAKSLNIHNTVGIDLVAMCVNDVLCTGARPLFFMDYLATGKLELETSEKILDGIVEGCKQSEMALIGGETAEMPGMYKNGEYDLAGFSVGEVMREDLIDGSTVKDGDTLIGLASSGFHSNGFSLLRKIVKEEETSLLTDLLTPTKIYWNSIKALFSTPEVKISGLAHITGGGLDNIARINDKFNYNIDKMPSRNDIPEFMNEVFERSKLSNEELYKTFNMGIGMVLVTSTPELVSKKLESLGEKFWRIGQVGIGEGKVIVKCR